MIRYAGTGPEEGTIIPLSCVASLEKTNPRWVDQARFTSAKRPKHLRHMLMAWGTDCCQMGVVKSVHPILAYLTQRHAPNCTPWWFLRHRLVLFLDKKFSNIVCRNPYLTTYLHCLQVHPSNQNSQFYFLLTPYR
jgi:hypothetical protein